MITVISIAVAGKNVHQCGIIFILMARYVWWLMTSESAIILFSNPDSLGKNQKLINFWKAVIPHLFIICPNSS